MARGSEPATPHQVKMARHIAVGADGVPPKEMRPANPLRTFRRSTRVDTSICEFRGSRGSVWSPRKSERARRPCGGPPGSSHVAIVVLPGAATRSPDGAEPRATAQRRCCWLVLRRARREVALWPRKRRRSAPDLASSPGACHLARRTIAPEGGASGAADRLQV